MIDEFICPICGEEIITAPWNLFPRTCKACGSKRYPVRKDGLPKPDVIPPMPKIKQSKKEVKTKNSIISGTNLTFTVDKNNLKELVNQVLTDEATVIMNNDEIKIIINRVKEN